MKYLVTVSNHRTKEQRRYLVEAASHIKAKAKALDLADEEFEGDAVVGCHEATQEEQNTIEARR